MHAKRVVLLVDDDADSREVFGAILRHGGYEVVEAEHGADALLIAEERKPALVVMDLEMPVLDGYSAMRALRAREDTAKVPIIALTAAALQRDLDRAITAGADVTLVKPCEPLQLLAAVRRLLV